MANSYDPEVAGTNGLMIPVASVSSGTPTSIGTVTNVAGQIEEVWLWACNIHTAEILLTINLGGTANGNKIMRYLPPMSGLIPIVEGHRMDGGVTIGAYLDGNASKVNILRDKNIITSS